jgi:hypothetical protein
MGRGDSEKKRGVADALRVVFVKRRVACYSCYLPILPSKSLSRFFYILHMSIHQKSDVVHVCLQT